MDRQILFGEDIPLTSQPIPHSLVNPLGIPTSKKNIPLFDILLALVSLSCFGIALTSVINNSVSWYVGQGTNQLILLGFLLSIMNLCLSSVTPTFFLLLEASFGPSTLQNYEGILRNQITASKLHICWRLLLGLMIALPVGLSVAYKTFTGGQSFRIVNATTYTGNTSYYGMFTLPGSSRPKSGLGIFFNITTPFFAASSPSSVGLEPRLPQTSETYGSNILLMTNKTTAILDIPQPDYLSTVQSRLADGESWNISASVFGTVASLNESKFESPNAWNKTFQSDCELVIHLSDNGFWSQNMYTGWTIVLMDRPGTSNQSRQYFGLAPDEQAKSCSGFSHYAYQYDITRRACQGIWQITRGSILLISGQCNSTILPAVQQLVFTDNTLLLGGAFLQGLLEVLGSFSDHRNESHWAVPSYTTAMAAMMWSKITALNGANSTNWGSFDSVSTEEAGLAYAVNDSVRYIRPTLQKSPVLCVLLGLQPTLLLLILGFSWYLSSAPIGKGFGLVSILSGIDPDTLGMLHGATLSGELKHSIKLSLRPVEADDRTYIKCSLVSSGIHIHNGKIFPKTVYA